jgi:hypothetical protein
MFEEKRKIQDRIFHLGFSESEVAKKSLYQKELIPCDFLQYVANGVKDDLEQLAF